MDELNQQQKEVRDLSRLIEDDKLKVEIFQKDGGQKDGGVRSQFTYQQNNYLNSSLRFADTKAGAIIAANGLIIKFITDFHATNGVSGVLFTGSIILIVIGILISLMVVFPKSLNRGDKGIIYWEHIVNTGKDQYIDTVKDGEVDQLLESTLKNNFTQAYILTKKFKKLNWAFTISLIGYFVAFIGIMISLSYKWW